jgi:hypothetical protein
LTLTLTLDSWRRLLTRCDHMDFNNSVPKHF